MERKAVDVRLFTRAEQRIARLTLILGSAAGGITGALHTWRWGAGILIGAGLAWANFRWLQDGLDALTRVSVAHAEKGKPRVPLWTMVRLLGRYALIAAAVYVIFLLLKVPIVSMLVGLCALGAATILASVYEILRPAR